jgi:hypothetical protein
MNATSTLVLILVLSFAADRVAKAIMFGLALLPKVGPYFHPPEYLRDQEMKVHRKTRLLIFYTVLVGAISAAAIYQFPELHIIRLLTDIETDWIDPAVTTIVVMGGSDLLGRLVQISGLGEGATAAPPGGSSRNEPIEISGRLVLEQPDAAASRIA